MTFVYLTTNQNKAFLIYIYIYQMHVFLTATTNHNESVLIKACVSYITTNHNKPVQALDTKTKKKL